jgi:Uncharacterized conserved protein
MLINFETQKSVQEVRTALEEKAKAKGFGVMAAHEVSNILKNKGVPIDYECVIVEVCSPKARQSSAFQKRLHIHRHAMQNSHIPKGWQDGR